MSEERGKEGNEGRLADKELPSSCVGQTDRQTDR